MKKAKYELPADFIIRLNEIYAKPEIDQILGAFETKRPTTLRVNRIKSTIGEVKQSLDAEKICYEPVSWYPDALKLPDVSVNELTALPAYVNGCFYIQSLSSMIPALILNPQPYDQVLDLCAAPGSKTTQMAMLMLNRGLITACDTSSIRIMKLQANLKTQGVTNTTVYQQSGQRIWQSFPEKFTKVLVDVPCSMEGRFTISDPKSYFTWTTSKIRELSHLQKWLLRSAVSAAKVGAEIVYSTCTLSPEENEGVIDWILKKERKSIVVDDMPIIGYDFQPGLLSWKGKTYHKDVLKCQRILPSADNEGFFVARLKKIASNVSDTVKNFN
jgi:NOL1/NOP2/sun family putative RNA methylase